MDRGCPAGTRSSLRPLFKEEARRTQSSGEMRREDAGVCLVVIASAACSEASRLFGYERIRGYGPVKEKAAADAKARYAQLAAADRRGAIASSVGPVASSCCAVRGAACFCSVNSMTSADDQCTWQPSGPFKRRLF